MNVFYMGVKNTKYLVHSATVSGSSGSSGALSLTPQRHTLTFLVVFHTRKISWSQ